LSLPHPSTYPQTQICPPTTRYILTNQASTASSPHNTHTETPKLTSTGDEDTKNELEKACAIFDPEPFWAEVHQKLPLTQQHNARAATQPVKTTDEDVIMKDASPSPSSNTPPKDRRGKLEPVDAFLSRLTPSKLSVCDADWIWVWNPAGSRKNGGDVASFTRKGYELLNAHEEESTRLRQADDASNAKTTAGLTRKLNPLRQELEKGILALARETDVTMGKWMLFPSVEHVDEVWRAVVRATEKGQLGDAAKVATDDGSGQSRLVCVYTVDFADEKDVKRVLCKLVGMDLVGKGNRGIYYKSDAYTHLNINSKNEYGLKASMYSSRDVLAWK
jgi:hypothetical protein